MGEGTVNNGDLDNGCIVVVDSVSTKVVLVRSAQSRDMHIEPCLSAPLGHRSIITVRLRFSCPLERLPSDASK
jgi:hypothetical protein